MRTSILVNGKRYEAKVYMYSYIDENKEDQYVNWSKVDGVEYNGRFEPIESLLNKRIEAYEELLAEHETEFMQEFLANRKLPFITEKMQGIAAEYQRISNIVDGLSEGLGIVVEGAYMEEDVDLSGEAN